jgi:hypothetical protein
MDALATYRDAIERVLLEYARIPYSYGDIRAEVVFDRARDRYLLVRVGWLGRKRVQGNLAHIDIIDGQVWIQSDGTEEGLATDLLAAGIPKDKIVLGFRAPELRADIDLSQA